MSRKADPILLRTGLNRLWKVNAAEGENPSNYQYLMRRFDKSLMSINAMLIDFSIFNIKTTHKTILQVSIFKVFPSRFKDRFRNSLYLASINEIYYYILWRRWFRINHFNVNKKAIPNFLNLFFYYSYWNKFMNLYTQKKLYYQTILLRYYLQKYFFHNTTGFLIDPLEHFNFNKSYKSHPIVFFLEKKDGNINTLNAQNKDIKWSENLTRLIKLCMHYGTIDFTNILVKFLATELEKDKRHWPIIFALTKSLKFIERDLAVKGIKIKFVGKLKGARRSRVHLVTVKWPNMPFLSLKNKILVSQATAHTIYGSVGIKVMVWKN